MRTKVLGVQQGRTFANNWSFIAYMLIEPSKMYFHGQTALVSTSHDNPPSYNRWQRSLTESKWSTTASKLSCPILLDQVTRLFGYCVNSCLDIAKRDHRKNARIDYPDVLRAMYD